MDETGRAGLPRRALAYLIDGCVILITFIPVMLLVGAVAGDQLLLATLLMLWGIGYFTVLESRSGRTPGKRLLKLRVVATDGAPLTPRASLIRNLLRIVDGQPGGLFLVAAVMIGAMPSRQRLGDLAAKTAVIVEAPAPVQTSELAEVRSAAQQPSSPEH